MAHRSGVCKMKICLGDFLYFSSCIDIQDVQLYLPSLPGKKDKQTSITNPFPNCRISTHLAGKQEQTVLISFTVTITITLSFHSILYS